MTESRGQALIVDDEAFFLEAIDEILSGAGFETVLAEDGESALEAAESPGIGVVVLDVRLPDIDGIQVLARLREVRPELPVIMLSASTDQEIVLEALRLGARDYLAKPLHDEELVLAVGRALEGYELSAGQMRLRGRIDRLVEGMEHLSQLVRLADPNERVSVLRQGIVEAAGSVLQAGRTSLMLVDDAQEWLSVVATTGADEAPETLSTRKVGEGASGVCFAEGSVLCVPDVAEDDRFAGRGEGPYSSRAFAVVPLVCLGVPVGVLCLTEGEDEEALSRSEIDVLRLLGMQISEFLAADPEVEALLAAASVMDTEGTLGLDEAPLDGDAELARLVCESIASESEPDRMLERALAGVAKQLAAAPVSLFLVSPDGASLQSEAEVDGGIVGDRESLPMERGLAGTACRAGQLVAVEAPTEDARFEAEVDTAQDGVPRPYLCVPLKLRGKVVGLLRAFPESGAQASPRTGEILAASFSAALRNVLLYRSLLQSIEEVAQARREARS